jgi:hypothetical protein
MSKKSALRARGAARRKREAKAVLVPNEETIAAMREARAGKLPRFEGTKDLLRELNEGD